MLTVLLLVLAAPKTFVCTRDGLQLKVLADSAEVATSPVLGKRLGFSLAGDSPNAYPRIEVTAAWEKLSAKPEATLLAHRPKLGADVQAFYRAGPGGPQLSAEDVSLAVKLSPDAMSAALTVSFRKGPSIECKLEKLPLVVRP